jgi:hypothetical protein
VTAYGPVQQKPFLSYLIADLIKNQQNELWRIFCLQNLPGKQTIDEFFNYFGLISNPPRTVYINTGPVIFKIVIELN